MSWSLFLFVLYYLAFQSLVAAMALLAWHEGYLMNTPAQARRRNREGNIGFLASHGGIWGDALWVSPTLAFIVAGYGDAFSVRCVIGLLVLSGLVGIPLLIQWMKEGKEVPSALGRDGYLTIGGAVHHFYMCIAFTLIVRFLFASQVRVRDIWIVTVVLMIHVALGVLQPIWHSTGRIPKETWFIFSAGWAALLVFALARTFV